MRIAWDFYIGPTRKALVSKVVNTACKKVIAGLCSVCALKQLVACVLCSSVCALW